MKIKVGIIGVGTIGTAHAGTIHAGKIDGMELGALCDTDKERIAVLKREYPFVPVFNSADELIKSGLVDAVIISTPHYFHPTIALNALENGLHVLSEKPIGVYTYGMEKLFSAHKKSGKIFAVMLNQRTNKLFKEAKRIIDSGELGKIKRSVWIITNWYRTQAYYDSGLWRGTWQGEGGGVLMNQAPHNLDIWQWLCGMPSSIYATCNAGKYHSVEVEDEATLLAEYENGASGVFITTTGDPAGVNRLEITGTKGRIVLEKGTLIQQIFSDDEEKLTRGECEKIEITERVVHDEDYNGHEIILQNFANAVLNGETLISPAADAINELVICNAAYLSAWKGEKISLPLNEQEYLGKLKERIGNSKNAKSQDKAPNLFENSYLSRWNTNW